KFFSNKFQPEIHPDTFARTFLLYDIGMLEDLDHLSARLAKLLAYTQQLFADQTALQARLSQVEAERDMLRATLDQQGSQTKALSRQAETAASERAVLQGSLDLFKQEHNALQAQLASKDKEVLALRDVTTQACQRIDAVLERLPGAAPAEEKP
ncbi:hypothetical protein, partial [Zwartia sp.]|uniref:hypothetical protein n=1 Tax=Zwartia sp. TaxID=2978004 RepID=UPI00271FFBE4